MKSQHNNVLHAFSVPDWSEMCGVVGVLTVLLLDCITFEGFFFPMLKKNFFFQKLAGLWLVGEVVNHVGLYGSKVAEGCSAFQRRSCWSIIYKYILGMKFTVYENLLWNSPDSKIHGANMGPTWAIRECSDEWHRTVRTQHFLSPCSHWGHWFCIRYDWWRRLQPTSSIIRDAKSVDSNLVDFDRKTCLDHPGILHNNSSEHSFSSTEKVSANVL